MVDVAQLVRVPDCDSGCCRFESGHPPEKDLAKARSFFIYRHARIPCQRCHARLRAGTSFSAQILELSFITAHELEREHGDVVKLRGVTHKRIDPRLHERANFGRFQVACIAERLQ